MNTTDEIIAGLTEKISNLHSAPVPNDRDDLLIQIESLKKSNERWQSDYVYLQRKIENVKGHIMDLYSMNGEIDEDMEEVARLLDIQLTKRIKGTMTIEVEFEADVPLGFDNDDFDLSYNIECDSYDAENFDWNEVSADWTVEDED